MTMRISQFLVSRLLVALLATACMAEQANGADRHPSGYAHPVLVGAEYKGPVDSETQRLAALGVIRRLLGEDTSAHFDVEIIPAEKGLDVFEVESKGKTIILRGSSGIAAGRGLKWYLNTLCHCSVSWRGDNLKLPAPLPSVPKKVRESTPFQYRYMFNYTAYAYSMAWWHWPEWERMLDVMALNGINLPLCPLGQEKAWQETYKEFGLSRADLNDFFAGPAWFPFQWMGCLDGWGGPLPQSVIEGHYELQQQILARARSLGMTPILQGFTGHVPQALKRKHPDLKVNQLDWQGFPPTDTLDWQESRFTQIGTTFLKKQKALYGTDHFYAIDPFIEMIPPTTNFTYISNMAKALFSSVDAADPKGIWVLQTWFCKSPQIVESYWLTDRTKIFFDAIPDQRLLALELKGEDWYWTGWKAQNGWYGKPWVWCAVQNFGDQVDLYGGLPQIFNNYNRMQASPNKGNPVGLGIDMEGLCCNPVVFELLFDMMWGDGVTDLAKWQKDYLLKRYGKDIPSVRQAWDILYATRYTIEGRTGSSPLCGGPGLWGDTAPEMDLVTAWKLILGAADELKDCPAYRFDLVNLGREVMGNYAPHYSFLAKQAFEKKDLREFRQCSADMLQYIEDFDRLMGTSEHFLLGRWTEGARSWGSTEEEKNLLQWGAKRQITDWGGNIGGYAVKEWSGYIKDRMLPLWEFYFQALEKSLKENRPYNADDYNQRADAHLKQWPDVRSIVPSEPQGNAVEVSREMWLKYGEAMLEKGVASGYLPPSKPTPPGIAVGKPITATSVYGDRKPEFAVDGQTYDREASWWSREPASLTVDLQKREKVLGFQVYPYWDGSRYYQYTIETSLDGKQWTMAVDMAKNIQIATPAGHLHNFKINMPEGFDCRYVRLNMQKNSANPGVHVVEFKLFRVTDGL